MPTTEYLNNDFKALTLSNTIADAKALFNQFVFTHFPVVENGVFYGLIAKYDLLGYEDLSKTLNEIRFSFQNFFTQKDVIWLDLIKQFSLNETNLIPVLNKKNEYIGYFELNEIVHFFTNTPFIQEMGNVLIVSKHKTDYSISEISQIVESNDAKLYGVFVSGRDANQVVLTIKLYSDNINDVIHTFRRYDYHIILGVN